MVFWPLHGVIRRLTERHGYEPNVKIRPLGRQFRRSMHIFVIDSGCDNMLNFNIAALGAPQFNTHRYGIYFADTPRHADLLLVLGPPVDALVDAVRSTIAQLPEPFGILLLGGEKPWDMIEPDRLVGHLPGTPGPKEILAALLAAQRGTAHRGAPGAVS